VRLEPRPPAAWDSRIEHPLQSGGFAEASRALGYRPLFAEDDDGLALVLVRQVPIPLLAGWTARAKVYAHGRHPGFLPRLIERLRALRVSHVRLGDSVWVCTGAMPDAASAVRPVTYYSFVHDLGLGDAAVLANAKRMIRRHIRKALEEVVVTCVGTPADLRDYTRLAGETGDRMRSRDVAAVYPPAYFEAIFREMVPRGQAAMFLARAEDAAPLAAATFVLSRDRCVQIHGASTRDRALTPKNGPTAVFWHAMRHARDHGCREFDMGAVTPTDDPSHAHHSVFEYKKLWGGRLVEHHAAELVVSPWRYRFQESVLAPMWDRLHPLYLRLFRAAPSPPPLPAETAAPLGLSHQGHRP
jgi:hypothetical protein